MTASSKARLLFAASVLLGALIWPLSPVFTGQREPWDAHSSPYYWIAMALAGFLPACLCARRFAFFALGACLGQAASFLALVAFSGRPGAMWPIGLLLVCCYSLLGLAGAALGAGLHLLFRRLLPARSARHPKPRRRHVGILPKKHFTWREPIPFLAVLDEHQRLARRWWHGPVFVLSLTTLMLLVWGAAHLDPAKHPAPLPWALLGSLGISALLFCFVQWYKPGLRSQVEVTNKCLVRGRGLYTQQIWLPHMASFSCHSTPDFHVLTFNRRHGGQSPVGVPPDFPLDPLLAFLSARLPLHPHEPTA